MPNQEVELRAILPKGKERQVEDKLQSIGASREGTSELTDIYFCRNEVKSFEEIYMREIGSYSLRIRASRANGSASPSYSMNMKIITQYEDHSSWKELETGVTSRQDAEDILRALGFKDYCTIEKKRVHYSYRNFHILLEDIKGFGHTVEVEILTTKEKGEEAKSEIRALMHGMGLTDEEIVPKSVTAIIMRRISKF